MDNRYDKRFIVNRMLIYFLVLLTCLIWIGVIMASRGAIKE